MATLHIFNPEHDLALASNLANFTAPHAGRQLRADLGFLPALWAEKNDVVLVDDVDKAAKAWAELSSRFFPTEGMNCSHGGKGLFLRWEKDLPTVGIDALDVWGWDLALCDALKRKGMDEALLPSKEQLNVIRQLSHRRTAARLLPLLRMEGTVGEAFECTREEEVKSLLVKYGCVVLKTPWSSSGRGLRFLRSEECGVSGVSGWFHNLVAQQGSVMVEPYYNKVKDFGMEFEADGRGCIRYVGLSLFHTKNGAYTGNILATEQAKRMMLGRYFAESLLDSVSEKIISCLDLGDYRGPFGIDMMVVRSEECESVWLHPCVEINLRRTMGHVALALEPIINMQKVMRIAYDGKHYQLMIEDLTN